MIGGVRLDHFEQDTGSNCRTVLGARAITTDAEGCRPPPVNRRRENTPIGTSRSDAPARFDA